ncbi:Nuclear hormone receptor family member nhr-47 [Caenorhabditis elegans]|uniref:Nuclear hormone receptor family member nhr-47 n=1 Tax=Caenorhabditis elegans TaxID=6239 RepID=NHR47_CAEEL|nr:Nuclear hormone receptor family member nhr-47 [Caenorhabditis elegans]Q17370.1 RecName: Full=Nuclear hormone receptor family member nhr-47 [Caenorhabditis elegans]AAA93297.1 Steroid hormone receptor-like protein [Caenorhabditis elegans]AAO39174.1 nuclear receptor NHR-47 [Caenorhabditis elegans]CCD65132.1 Nuclear hormone receptor family member nhr-47 [Caenorhabditis elegans]|eukprot:NP_504455.1 Nuclear hormone receptor family member nhr-47 [Caenorhabditis elegans]
MSEKLPPGTLCAVCDDIATGKHYSVASCNGCKTFFRRALVNNREFVCQGNKDCPVNKGVRCACRYCRLQKCLAVGMDKNSIQNDRDRIGYTKRKRRHDDNDMEGGVHHSEHIRDGSSGSPQMNDESPESMDMKDIKIDLNCLDPIADRLTTLENNFTLLLSRCADLHSYATLEDALNAPSRFMQPISCEWSDNVVLTNRDDKLPFWRQRLIALYIDWAKTFSTFRSLPYADKVAMVTNHASSFMIMCEAFRTPEHMKSDVVRKRPDLPNIVTSNSGSGCSRVSSVAGSLVSNGEDVHDDLTNLLHAACIQQSINKGIMFGENSSDDKILLNLPIREIKKEPLEVPSTEGMIQLPTEYGNLPADYASWIPQDYGHPTAGHEGKSDMHNFFEARDFCVGRPSSCNLNERSMKTVSMLESRNFQSPSANNSSLSGITPVLTMMIDLVMKPFRQLNFSTTEFALLQAIMFFDPDTEGLDSASQRNVVAEQKKLLAVLFRHLQKAYNPQAASERYASIILRMPSIRRAAAKKNESLQVLDMLQMHEINSLVKETSLGPRPSNVQQRMGIGGGAGGCLTFPSQED